MITAIAVTLALWVVGLGTYCWVLKTAFWELWRDYDHLYGYRQDVWQWLVNANGRRKKVERVLKKQQAKYRRLVAEHQALAADVVGELLTSQDREIVTKSLTRRIP